MAGTLGNQPASGPGGVRVEGWGHAGLLKTEEEDPSWIWGDIRLALTGALSASLGVPAGIWVHTILGGSLRSMYPALLKQTPASSSLW